MDAATVHLRVSDTVLSHPLKGKRLQYASMSPTRCASQESSASRSAKMSIKEIAPKSGDVAAVLTPHPHFASVRVSLSTRPLRPTQTCSVTMAAEESKGDASGVEFAVPFTPTVIDSVSAPHLGPSSRNPRHARHSCTLAASVATWRRTSHARALCTYRYRC